MLRRFFFLFFITSVTISYCQSSTPTQDLADDDACYKAMNKTKINVTKIVDSSRVAQCTSSKKYCYNLDWNAGLSSDEALKKKSFTCFDEIIVYYGRDTNYECCSRFLKQTFRPRDDGSVVNTEPINHLLCENERQVYINIKASWSVEGRTENVDETKSVVLNDDLPTCEGNLHGAPGPTPPAEPPQMETMKQIIPIIVLALMITLIALCFLFSLCQKKMEKAKKMSKKDEEVSKSNQSQDSTDQDSAANTNE